jgi:uroporphyrin-3 C-methyltransferase
MTEDQKPLSSPGIPEAVKPDTAEAEDGMEVDKTKPSGGRAGLIILILILLVGMGGASFYQYQVNLKQAGQLAQLQQQLSDTRTLAAGNDVSADLDQIRAIISGLADDVGTIPDIGMRLDTLQSAVQASHEIVNRGQREWVVAEVEYLIRVASQRLRLMRDYQGAVAALEAADQRLHELADPSLLPVREALADDMRALRDFKRPDVIGIALALDRMISRLEPMPLNVPALDTSPQAEQESQTTEEASTEESEERSLSHLMAQAWETLNQRVTVRHYGESVESLPDRERELLLNQMLRLRLEAARISVMRQDDHDFHQQLAAALEMINQYYRPEASAGLRTEIESLNTVNLRPELPDITLSLKRLEMIENAVSEEQLP